MLLHDTFLAFIRFARKRGNFDLVVPVMIHELYQKYSQSRLNSILELDRTNCIILCGSSRAPKGFRMRFGCFRVSRSSWNCASSSAI